MTELTELTLHELRGGLDSRKFSSVELAKAYIARMDKYADLNCYLNVAKDKIISDATSADKQISAGAKGPLLGIPFAVKDVVITKGQATTCGSKILSNFIPPYDATVMLKLKTAGAISLGKTNMDEFAMGSSTENSAFGAVKNPWDTTRVPGGSSGGSAAAVAARLAPLAIGTDTGGSIRQPAALCNIVGIKPTYGRVSRYGLVAFASSLDQIGGFSRCVYDCAVFLQMMAGYDPMDSTSVKIDVPNFTASCERTDVKGLRIGVPREYFISGVQPEVEKSVKTAIQTLEGLGARAVEISLPNTEAAVAVYYILAPAEASSNLARYDGVRYGKRATEAKDLMDLYCRSRSEGFGREVKRRIMIGTYVLSAGYFDAYYLRAQKVRTLIANDFKQAFEKDCDVIVCPTSPTTAFKLGEKISDPLAMYLSDVFTIPVNLAGLPGISIPCGFDANKLPIGLQIIGKPWDEETLFRVASAYETNTDWHKRALPI